MIKNYIAAAGILMAVNSVQAVQIYGTPNRLLQDDTNFGGCMVALEVDGLPISQQAPGCGDFYVTFDCLATAPTTRKSAAAINFDAAKLAYVTREKIAIEVDPNININGYCVGRRVDNFIE